MINTPFDARSSEWIGCMTVRNPESAEDNSLRMERLRRGLRLAWEQELTPCQQQVLTLYYDQGLTVSQIARQLGVNASTVSRTLRRAQKRLQRCLRYAL